MHRTLRSLTLLFAAGCAARHTTPLRAPMAYPFTAEKPPSAPTGAVRLRGVVYDHGRGLVVVLREGLVNRTPTAEGDFGGLSVDLVSGNPEGTWQSEAASPLRRAKYLPFRGDTLADSVVFTLPPVQLTTLGGHWIVIHEWRVRQTGATQSILTDWPIATAPTIFDAAAPR